MRLGSVAAAAVAPQVPSVSRLLDALAVVLSLVLVGAARAQAHEITDSYLRLDAAADGHLSGAWELPDADVEDLWSDRATTLDGKLALVATHRAAILEATHDDLSLADGEAPCPLVYGPLAETTHKGRPYTVMPFTAQCATAALRVVEVTWRFLNEAEDKHVALVNFSSPGGTQAAVLSRDEPVLRLGMVGVDLLAHCLMYFHDGVLHIWTGLDHILFLLTLILPAVFFLERKRWQPRERFRETGLDILKTVSSFTVAHSLTLCLVTFHLLSLPSRLVESVIALSVLLAGLNNLLPVVDEGRWKLAFLFGLVHGIGFAEVLVDLRLPTGALVNALIGFNLGVETGQLAIVAASLPAAYLLRRTLFYRRFVFAGGSAMAMAVAAFWLVDRAFGLELMPF